MVPIVQPVPIVPAHRITPAQHFSREANFAGHSTDMEVNGSFVSAKNSVAFPFSMKEYTVIRPFLTALWSSRKMFGVTAMGCVLASAGMLQAQSSGPAPQPLAPWVRPTIAPPVPTTIPAPVTPVDPVAPALAAPALAAPSAPIVDPMVKPASGCASCGGGGCGHGGACLSNDYGPPNNTCVPGRLSCCIPQDTVCGRFFGGLCEELCCPDPCYEPEWIAEANAAFFQDSPRPVTQTRLRWDNAMDYRFPDTAEFFQAQDNVKGPKFVTPSLKYNELTLYQEVAAKGFSMFVEVPYLSIDPATGPSSAGMGDMNMGVKTVLLDRELLLVSMQFKTYLPTGNFTVGVGNGHVSLEPSILAALKICPGTYLQTEIAEWFPLGGTGGFAGSVFHFHASLNQNLCHWGDCVNVVGVLEVNGYSYNGAFTDDSGNVMGMTGSTFANAGPGIRVQLCDKVDIGFAADFGFGNLHGPGQIYRTELRIRY